MTISDRRSLRIFLIFLKLNVLFSSAQSQINSDRISLLENYFKFPRELLYVHLNKDTYLAGEEIWFKIYTLDQKNKIPSLATTNINIELYNEQGREVFSGLFLAQNGNAIGNISIPKDSNSGQFYIKASTNWMNNFIEDDSFTQRISVIGMNGDSSIARPPSRHYDLQLLPEGGNLVESIENTVGVKLLDNKGLGIAEATINVFDDQRNKITEVKLNKFGLGSFQITPRKGRKYYVESNLNESEKIKVDFPDIYSRGLSLRVNNLLEDKVLIEVNTNQNTKYSLGGDNLFLLVHQENKVKEYNVNFNSSLGSIISIDRKDLFSGINVITLFRENKPVAERLIFNNKLNSNPDISLSFSKADSIEIDLKILDTLEANYNLSISVLPEETEAYSRNETILDAFLLSPYLKGQIESPYYYFDHPNRKKNRDLDLLLLTQGWSRYRWENIFDYQPKIDFTFNRGLKYKLIFNNTKKNTLDEIFIHPTKFQEARIESVINEDSIIIKEFFPERGELIRFSGINNNGSFTKPKLFMQLKTNRVKRPLNKEIIRTFEFDKTPLSIENFFYEDVEVLDTVKFKIKDKLKTFNQDFIPEIIRNKSKEITLKEVQNYPFILDYVRANGFKVIYGDGIFDPNSGSENEVVSIFAQNNVSFNGSSPEVYLDDIRLSNFEILLNFPTRDVERILVDRNGTVSGLNGTGTIHIYTRKTPLDNDQTRKSNKAGILEYKVMKGFEPTKEFYVPRYYSFNSSTYRKYGVVHWFPDLFVKGNKTFKLRVPNFNLNAIKLFIEGIADDGKLVSKVETIFLN